MPDGNKTEPPQFSSLPAVGLSQVLGLLELLKSKGGKEDIYKLAAELKMELGETLTVIRAAEILALVNTPGGDVVLEPQGEKITRAKIRERKEMLGQQMEQLSVFKKVSEFLREKEEHEATRDEVLEKLAELIPNDDAENSFATIVHWGRYAALFGYNDDTETFYLESEETEGDE